MEYRLSYDECSKHFLALFVGIARRGQGSLPVFSGDLSVALRLRHRVIKDLIERHFTELRQAYSGSIQVVRYKRRGGCRAMRGYLLPFQVLLVCEGVEGPLLAHAEVLHLGLSGGGPYQALLN